MAEQQTHEPLGDPPLPGRVARNPGASAQLEPAEHPDRHRWRARCQTPPSSRRRGGHIGIPVFCELVEPVDHLRIARGRHRRQGGAPHIGSRVRAQAYDEAAVGTPALSRFDHGGRVDRALFQGRPQQRLEPGPFAAD